MTAPVQALVVVDMQRGLLAGPHAVVGAAALTARVEELIGRATAAGVLVLQLQHDGAAGQVDEPGRAGWEPALAGGTVIRKSTRPGRHPGRGGGPGRRARAGRPARPGRLDHGRDLRSLTDASGLPLFSN